jgi:hypothetical protein
LPAAGAGLTAPGVLGTLPFAHGETLVYELSWLGIVGGTAELAVEPPAEHQSVGEGTLAYRITSRARSNAFFTRIFPVDDRTESLVDAQRFRTLRFEKHLREGSRRRDQVVLFDPLRNVASSDGVEMPTPAAAVDALAALYYVRGLELVAGRSVDVAVYADGRNYQLQVEVLGRERIHTPFGERLAWKVEPHQQYEGVFAQKGRLWVWIADDASRLPLLMRSSLAIGSIAARLVAYRLATGTSGAPPVVAPLVAPPTPAPPVAAGSR